MSSDLEELKIEIIELRQENADLRNRETDLDASLIKTKEDAIRASEAKSRFLANMSHEIRNPLAIITGFTQILLLKAKRNDLPDSSIRQLENIETASENLIDLINNILDISKIEAGMMNVVDEDVDLKHLINNICDLHREKASVKKITLDCIFSPQLPTRIISDRSKLTQILINLVGNALKFTSEGNSVTIKVSLKANTFIIEVIDQGIGIEESDWEAIFETFKQVDSSNKRKFGGTGLGLTISKSLVALLGGEIWVESVVGKGTTFFVKLPLKLASGTPVEDSSYSDFVLTSEDKLVLCIEDDNLIRDLMKSFFQEIGIRYDIAENGKLGVEKALEINPDLIFMDMHMPIMNGLEATAKLRSEPRFKDLPIIVISGDAFKEQQDKALSEGVTDYLTKPVNLETLVNTLNTHLSSSKALKDDSP